MINLLPPAEKQNLVAEEQFKIVLILGVILLIFFTSLILVLISVNFSLGIQLNSQNILLANKENEAEKAGIENMKNQINQANQKLLAIHSFYGQKVDMTDLLEKISNILPEGTYLNSVSINPLGSAKNIFQVALSGHASLVNNVIALKDRLKQDEEFASIAFPDDTWFKKQNFDFNVSFQVTISK